jgi:hypothetical protein
MTNLISQVMESQPESGGTQACNAALSFDLLAARQLRAVYGWLPWTFGVVEKVPKGDAERL